MSQVPPLRITAQDALWLLFKLLCRCVEANSSARWESKESQIQVIDVQGGSELVSTTQLSDVTNAYCSLGQVGSGMVRGMRTQEPKRPVQLGPDTRQRTLVRMFI